MSRRSGGVLSAFRTEGVPLSREPYANIEEPKSSQTIPRHPKWRSAQPHGDH